MDVVEEIVQELFGCFLNVQLACNFLFLIVRSESSGTIRG